MKKIILYGAGKIGKDILSDENNKDIFAFADSDKNKCGTFYCGKYVYNIDDLKKMENINIFLSVSKKYRNSVQKLLIENNLENVICPYYRDVNVNTGNESFIGQNVDLEGENYIGNYSELINSKMGYASYVGDFVCFDNVSVGRYTSIASHTKIIKGQHPVSGFVSTHPAFYACNNHILSYVDKTLFCEYRFTESGYSVDIGNDVWIGEDVSIMEGVKIADGTIVAAGTLVTKNTEPYSVIGGVPGRIIKYRFEKDDIDFLLKLKWWTMDKSWIQKNHKLFTDINLLKKYISKNN